MTQFEFLPDPELQEKVHKYAQNFRGEPNALRGTVKRFCEAFDLPPQDIEAYQRHAIDVAFDPYAQEVRDEYVPA